MLLAACGGGGGGSDNDTSQAETAVRTTVIDGALQNVQVCLDKNANGTCDASEPAGKTDAAGNATINVPNAELGLYPILAIVGTDAVDADTGAVPVAYSLKAPADNTSIVSPLTTLVQAHVESVGGTSADAASAVQVQLGLGTSPFADFTQDSSSAGKLAGTLARLIVVATQNQRSDTSGALKTDGQPMRSSEVDAAINGRLLQLLPTLANAVTDNPTLADPTLSIADKQAALATVGRQVADASGLTAGNIGIVTAAQPQPSTSESVTTGIASASLRWFTFTDVDNFFLRGYEWTAQQNTPDSNGKRHFTEFRETVAAGEEQPWTRNLVYWTGSEWFTCPTSFEHESSTATTGETESRYCNAQVSRSRQNSRDIANLKIRDVLREIRSYVYTDPVHGSFANWGPAPELIPADATWPAGSLLSYRTVTDIGGSQYYTNNSSGRALIPPANAPQTTDTSLWVPATLDEFIAWNAGDFANSVTTGQVNGNNSRVLIGRRDYVKPDGSAAYKRYLAGFESGGSQKARFYECEGNTATLPKNSTLYIDGASTCKAILTTSYSIESQGDAKVLRFAEEPAQLNAAGSPPSYRLFIERAGITFAGFRDKPSVSYQQRLNQTAAEALLASVGIN